MRQSRGFRSSLVVLELALAMIVVVGGTLMARSFYLLMHLDTGVRADQVITMSVRLSDSTCNDLSQQSQPGGRDNQPQKKKSGKNSEPDMGRADVMRWQPQAFSIGFARSRESIERRSLKAGR